MATHCFLLSSYLHYKFRNPNRNANAHHMHYYRTMVAQHMVKGITMWSTFRELYDMSLSAKTSLSDTTDLISAVLTCRRHIRISALPLSLSLNTHTHFSPEAHHIAQLTSYVTLPALLQYQLRAPSLRLQACIARSQKKSKTIEDVFSGTTHKSTFLWQGWVYMEYISEDCNMLIIMLIG